MAENQVRDSVTFFNILRYVCYRYSATCTCIYVHVVDLIITCI